MSVSNDSRFMRLALEQAALAAESGEVPVGAVLVRHGEVIGLGHNLTLREHDPTAHAEVIALRQGAQFVRSARVIDTTLYVTLEPCAMCVGAIIQARVGRLVYGAREPKTGAVVSVFDLLMSAQHNHRVAISEGVLAGECSALMVEFFRQRRLL